MDFRYRYSDEQERFRREIQVWFRENLPLDSGVGLQRTIPLFPSWLAERLDAGDELTVVLHQELERRGLRWAAPDAAGILDAVKEYGSPEQRRTFLDGGARNGPAVWTPAPGSNSAADPASAPIDAFRDGDDYILDGADLFRGLGHAPGYLWTQAVSGRDGPAPAVSAFLVPAGWTE